MRVFNPYVVSSETAPTLAAGYRRQECFKKCFYEQRIQHFEVDGGSFTPLMFSCSGSAGPSATSYLKRLASLLSEKRDIPYSSTVGWLRCRLSLALFRSSLMCLRGSRSSAQRLLMDPVLACAEARVDH